MTCSSCTSTLRELTSRLCAGRSGSGCVSAFLGSICGASSARESRQTSRCAYDGVLTLHDATVYLCTDLNPHATRCTRLTGLSNSIPLNPVLTDLTSALLPRLERSVDVLVFNPPYVETEDEEAEMAQEGGAIERAWAGGKGGMRVTDRLLEQVEVRSVP